MQHPGLLPLLGILGDCTAHTSAVPPSLLRACVRACVQMVEVCERLSGAGGAGAGAGAGTCASASSPSTRHLSSEGARCYFPPPDQDDQEWLATLTAAEEGLVAAQQEAMGQRAMRERLAQPRQGPTGGAGAGAGRQGPPPAQQPVNLEPHTLPQPLTLSMQALHAMHPPSMHDLSCLSCAHVAAAPLADDFLGQLGRLLGTTQGPMQPAGAAAAAGRGEGEGGQAQGPQGQGCGAGAGTRKKPLEQVPLLPGVFYPYLIGSMAFTNTAVGTTSQPLRVGALLPVYISRAVWWGAAQRALRLAMQCAEKSLHAAARGYGSALLLRAQWHVEDFLLQSINLLAAGRPKIWWWAAREQEGSATTLLGREHERAR